MDLENINSNLKMILNYKLKTYMKNFGNFSIYVDCIELFILVYYK